MIKTLLKLAGTFGILGVVGLLVLLVLGYIVYRVLKHRFGGFLAKAALASQPTEIHLVRERAPSWDDRGEVAERVDALRAVGFRALGTYSIEEMGQLQFVALAHPQEGCGAAVYEHDEGHWIDLFVRLRDTDSWLTVSNSPNKIGEKLPARFEKHWAKPGSDADALWKIFHKRLKHRLVVPVTPENYVAEFQAGYREEVQARFDAAGIEPDGSFGGAPTPTLQRDPEQDAAAAPLFDAIAARDLDRLREVLAPGPALGPTLEGRDADGKTPLMAAILTGDLQFVQALLDAGADPSATAPGRPNSPFMNPPSMSAMADEIDDPEAKRFMKGFGSVMGALGADSQDVATLTPVLLGLWVEDLYIVAALIESGATVEGPEGSAPKPLGYAIARGDLDAARWLLQSGADPNAADADDERAIDAAIEARDVEAVQVLLEFGVDVDIKDDDGDTPIVLAAELGADEIFEVLAPHAKKNLRKARKAMQETADLETNVAAEALVQAAGDGASQRVRRLLGQGVPADAVGDEDGPTALMMAAQMGQVRVLRMLLDAGADPNLRRDDETALHRAATPQFMDPRVQPEVIQILLDAGANLEALDDEARAQVIRGLERGGGALPAVPA